MATIEPESELGAENAQLNRPATVSTACRCQQNLLKQGFYASGPNQKLVGDITYLRTDEGWLYIWRWSWLVNVATNDRITGLRRSTDGIVAAKAPGKCHRTLGQRRAILLSRLSGTAETVQPPWQHERKGQYQHPQSDGLSPAEQFYLLTG
jgi:transposase InsO family protein